MRVSTILAEGNIHTGPTGPQASPADFGNTEGLDSMAHGLLAVSSGANRVADAIDQRKHMEDTSWAAQAAMQEKATVNEWMADPANNSKDTYAQDLRTFMNDRLNTYSQTNASPRAQAMFRQHFMSFMSGQFEVAVHATARNKIMRAANGVDDQSGNALDAWRSGRDIPYADANGDLLNSIGTINSSIDGTFGQVMPELAKKLKEKVVTDATYATMRDDPKFAQQILGTNKTLDEHTRHTIENQIEESLRSKGAIDMIAFDRRRADLMANVSTGKTRDKLNLGEYQPYMPRDKALALKAKDDALIDTYNQINDVYSEIRGWNPSAQSQRLGELEKSANGAQDVAVIEELRHRLGGNQGLLEKNPVSWLQQNNPRVKDALQSAMDSTEQTRVQKLGELYDVMLKYQGYAPQDDFTEQRNQVTGDWEMVSVPAKDKNLYLGLPSNGRHLMTSEEATQYADQVNSGSAQGALKQIQQILSRYKDPRHEAIAFNDLVTQPTNGRGLKQEYQLAFLNAGAPWVDAFIGSVDNAEQLKKVQPDKILDYERALSANSSWLKFSHSMMGDNFGRGKEIEGFRQGILSYAYGLTTQSGMSPERAIKESASKLLESELGFTSMNGQTMMISRDRGIGKPMRTDDEILSVGRYLERSLQSFDPREIKLTDEYGRKLFPALDAAGSDLQKMRSLRSAIMGRGFFQTSADGRSATLYYHDGQNHFELRDQNNRAFRINFEEVENARREEITSNLAGAASSNEALTQYEAQHHGMTPHWQNEYAGPGVIDGTWWPTMPSFIHPMLRGGVGGTPPDPGTIPEMRKSRVKVSDLIK